MKYYSLLKENSRGFLFYPKYTPEIIFVVPAESLTACISMKEKILMGGLCCGSASVCRVLPRNSKLAFLFFMGI